MQYFYADKVIVPTSSDLKKSAKEYVMTQLDSDVEFMWFDKELKELTGTDIFAYPFDKEKGYAWIKEGNVEILVLKMEQMDKNEEIVGKFVELQDLKYVNSNIGEGKYSKYIYQELKKQFSLQTDWLRAYYMGNERFLHFYSETEIDSFCNRWGRSGL